MWVQQKFCSNACYRASQYIEQQIPDTPVWTRRDEMETQFDLLQHKARGYVVTDIVCPFCVQCIFVCLHRHGICAHTHACLSILYAVYSCVFKQTRHMHRAQCIYTHTHACMYTHARTCTSIYTHKRTHTHTHTRYCVMHSV